MFMGKVLRHDSSLLKLIKLQSQVVVGRAVEGDVSRDHQRCGYFRDNIASLLQENSLTLEY